MSRAFREDIFVLLLVFISAFVFFAFSQSQFLASVVYLIWSFLFLAHALWTEEILKSTKTPISSVLAKSHFLPRMILKAMDQRQSQKAAESSKKFFSPLVIVAVFFLGLYLLWGIYCRIDPAVSPEYYLWFANAQLALQKFEPDIVLRGFDSGFHVLLLHLIFCIFIAGVFWFVSAAVYAARSLGMFLISLAFLFALMAIAYFLQYGAGQNITAPPDFLKGYGWGFTNLLPLLNLGLPESITPLAARIIETGWIGAGLLYASAFCITVKFVQILLTVTAARGVFALAGVCVLIMLALMDVFLLYTPSMQGLWLSGWSLVAALGVGARQPL